MPINRQILLDNRPQGEASEDNFKLVSTETPALQNGQVLVRHHFLSLDPYMRGRMSDAKNYAQPQPPAKSPPGPPTSTSFSGLASSTTASRMTFVLNEAG